MNTGLGDAENLAWKLAMLVRGRAGEALLDTYSAERRPVAKEVLASTSSLTRLVLGASTPARLLRDHLLVPVLNAPLVQRLVWEQASQLKLSYRRGPLAERSWRPRPWPGDRVADIAGSREDGRPSRLHAELGAQWVLLAPATAAGDACTAAANRALVATGSLGWCPPNPRAARCSCDPTHTSRGPAGLPPNSHTGSPAPFTTKATADSPPPARCAPHPTRGDSHIDRDGRSRIPRRRR
jgi:4,5-epoxidase